MIFLDVILTKVRTKVRQIVAVIVKTVIFRSIIVKTVIVSSLSKTVVINQVEQNHPTSEESSVPVENDQRHLTPSCRIGATVSHTGRLAASEVPVAI